MQPTAPANGGVSFWWADLGGVPGLQERRPPLPASTEADVCIVGGGYTGLWTAYYLAQAAPRAEHRCARAGILRLRRLRA